MQLFTLRKQDGMKHKAQEQIASRSHEHLLQQEDMEWVLSIQVFQGSYDWVFSTIHLHFKTWKPLGRICSQSMTASFRAQTPRRPLQGCSTISTSQPSFSLTHRALPPFL